MNKMYLNPDYQKKMSNIIKAGQTWTLSGSIPQTACVKSTLATLQLDVAVAYADVVPMHIVTSFWYSFIHVQMGLLLLLHHNIILAEVLAPIIITIIIIIIIIMIMIIMLIIIIIILAEVLAPSRATPAVEGRRQQRDAARWPSWQW